MSPISGAVPFIRGSKCRLAEAEARVGDQEEVDQIALYGRTACLDELGCIRLVQIELDYGSGDIPRGILAAD